MRTIAIRVEDELHSQLTLLAQLSERPLVDEVKEAIDVHIARRSSEVDLTAQAKKTLAEIDRSAAAKRKAIEALLSKSGKPASKAKPKAGEIKAP